MTKAKRADKGEAPAEAAVPAKMPKLTEKSLSSPVLARPEMPCEGDSASADAMEFMKQLIPWVS